MLMKNKDDCKNINVSEKNETDQQINVRKQSLRCITERYIVQLKKYSKKKQPRKYHESQEKNFYNWRPSFKNNKQKKVQQLI